MERIKEQSAEYIAGAPSGFHRFLFYRISLDSPIIGIVGPRGVGKSSLLLQIAREKFKDAGESLYVSVDDPFFSLQSLYEVAADFVRYGGLALFIDDLHRYPNALVDLLRIEKEFRALRIIFTCSSAGDGEGLIYELSRFAELHFLPVLSFREFLQFRHALAFPVIRFEDLLDYNRIPGMEVLHRTRPLPFFEEYLKTGMYLFDPGTNRSRNPILDQIRMTVSEDIMAVYHMDYPSLAKVNRILMWLAEEGPVKPNIEQLAEMAGTTRDSLLKFLKYLTKAGLVGWLTKGSEDLNYQNKPDRLFVNNPNLMLGLASSLPSRSGLLESFVHHQLRLSHQVNLLQPGLFLVDLEIEFELDWMKTGKRLAKPTTYQLLDGMEKKAGSRIPIWMLGFLY